jgi:uncharacterized protein YecE (DUF72 family)
MARIYLGTQGWSYKDWVGPFYPGGTQSRDYLTRYAQEFNAVELDTTFYGIPNESRVDAWNSATPDGFQFTAKVPRSITHDRHLMDSSPEMEDFLRTMERLGPKLGPVLIQLPPDFTTDEREALQAFLKILPAGFRYAAEFRHRSWLIDDTFDLLAQYDVAWTCIDLSYMPRQIAVTTDFVYVRWLGNRKQIEHMDSVQIDRHQDLEAWAAKLEEEANRVQRIYGFVNNHYSGHSPSDVRYLRRRLGMPEPLPPEPQLEQGSLL